MMLFESFCLEVLPSWVSLSVCVLLSLLSFQGLSIICDEWLVPALEVICVSLSIPEDIAGVTFMAFGSAAPEIVINSVSTIKTVVRGGDDGGEGLQSQSEDEAREQNMGVGAILGSGIIAFTIIPGICALVAPEGMVLKRRPLIRDVVAYTTCLSLLIYHVNSRGSLGVYESGPLLVVYACFLLIVIFSPAINKKCCRSRRRGGPDKKKSFVLVRLETLALQRQLAAERRRLIEDDKKKRILEYDDEEAGKKPRRDYIDDIYHYGTLDSDEEDGGSQEEASEEDTLFVGKKRREDETCWGGIIKDAWEGFDEEDDDNLEDFFEEDAGIPMQEGTKLGCYCTLTNVLKVSGFILRLPMLAIPRSTVKTGSGLFRGVTTFAMSFVVVSYFSFILTTVISHLAENTPLSAPFYGTAVVSIGAEIPDLIQCSTVARRGYGSMAISNVLGSQVINICLGLGAPWFFSALYGKDVKFKNKEAKRDLNVASAVLATAVGIFALCTIGQALLRGEKPRVGKYAGVLLTASYVLGMGGFIVWYLGFNLRSQ